jgi:hypothetical protein
MRKSISQLTEDQIIGLIYYLAVNCSMDQYKKAIKRIGKSCRRKS